MKSRWIIAGAAALSLGLLTLPMLRPHHGGERVTAAAGARGASSAEQQETCDASGAAKLDFVLKDMNNTPVRMANYRGKVILLNFWATWCGPCKEEIPAFVELYERYREKGMVIVGVSIDDRPDQLRAFAREWHMQYPVLQLQSDIEDAYGPFYGVPTSYIIARDGSICTRHLGPMTKDELERQIKALL